MLILYLYLVMYVIWQGPDLATFSLTSAAFFVALPFLFRRYKEHDFTLGALRRGRVIIGLLVAICLTGGCGFFSHLVKVSDDPSSSSDETSRRLVSNVVEPFGYEPWMALFFAIVFLIVFLLLSIRRSRSLQRHLIDQLSAINDGVKFSVNGSS